jgi:hypothetical protein
LSTCFATASFIKSERLAAHRRRIPPLFLYSERLEADMHEFLGRILGLIE